MIPNQEKAGNGEKVDPLTRGPDDIQGRVEDAATPVMGENFYLRQAEREFVGRVGNWLNYLGIPELFPGLDGLVDRINEAGSKLRSAGDASVLGNSDSETGIMLIRPGDYAALLHEAAHVDPQNADNLLRSEAGAFALQIFAAGDFEGTLAILHGGSSIYSARDKRLGRLIAEASLVLGREVFDVLKGTRADARELDVAIQLRDAVMAKVSKAKERFAEERKTGLDYLVEEHGLTPFVATYLLNVTGDTNQTIVRSTSQSKKDVIGAFKALVSFYSVNLGYSLEDAVRKTEEHFRREEAMSLHHTLMFGAKDVFAKLQEYAYPIEACKALSEMMISRGSVAATLYAKGMPDLLELCGQFGPNGTKLLTYAFENPAFLDTMVLTDGAEGMLKLARTRPELARRTLAELQRFDWKREQGPRGDSTQTKAQTKDLGWLIEVYAAKFLGLPTQEQARLAACAFYLAAMLGEQTRLLGEQHYVYTNIGYVLGCLPQGKSPSELMEMITNVAALPEESQGQR